MNILTTGRFLKFSHLSFLTVMFFSANISTINAAEFDPCTDLLIDQTTNIAYGAHGAPFNGEYTCYRDSNKKIATIQRKFINGTASGQHFCFDEQGLPKWVIVYNNGKPWKTDIFKRRYNKPKTSKLPTNYVFTECNASEWTKAWCAKADFKTCLSE